MRRAAVALISIVWMAGCTAGVDPIGSVQEAVTPIVVDCNVTGFGSLPTGEAFSGSASSVSGAIDAEWVHDGAGIHVESSGPPDSVICHVNGEIVAEISGPATVDGNTGYSYYVNVVDNRDPPDDGSIVLEASRGHHGHPVDGVENFSDPTTVSIPQSIEVTDGEAEGWVMLKLDRTACWYFGDDDSHHYHYDHHHSHGHHGHGHDGDDDDDGGAFEFVRCVGPGAHGLAPGDTLDVTHARLHIASASFHRCHRHGREELAVRADIGAGPSGESTGTADTYTIIVTGGGSTYTVADSLEDGDILIDVVP